MGQADLGGAEGDTYGALSMPMVVPLQYIATHRHHVDLRRSGVPLFLHWELLVM